MPDVILPGRYHISNYQLFIKYVLFSPLHVQSVYWSYIAKFCLTCCSSWMPSSWARAQLTQRGLRLLFSDHLVEREDESVGQERREEIYLNE